MIFNGSTDVAFADYGPTWESLRRVSHGAVIKYARDEKLALLVNDVVGEKKLLKLLRQSKTKKESTSHLMLLITSI